MVKTLNRNSGAAGAFEQGSPFVVELVGLAGAGKTTVSQALNQRDERILIGAELELRKLAHIPLFVGNISSLLPIYFQRDANSRWFKWDELKSMVYLGEWPRILRRQVAHRDTMMILDHGPVFKLATLHAFGPKRLAGPGFSDWWSQITKQWASFLDLIIWLEASETNLIARINQRRQRHDIKGKSDREASAYLARYRGSYEHILARLKAHGGPNVLHFDTGKLAFEQIVDHVLAACQMIGAERFNLT